jgi:hypothetical protein
VLAISDMHPRRRAIRVVMMAVVETRHHILSEGYGTRGNLVNRNTH